MSEKVVPYIATLTKNDQTMNDKESAEYRKIISDVIRISNEFIQTISIKINRCREILL